MAVIQPFSALRYDTAKAGVPASALVCPPYDVIDSAMQKALYNKSTYNVVRVEYGKTKPSDGPGDDRYSRAAAEFSRWIAEGVLRRDTKAAYYVYEQTFDIASGGASQSNVVARRGVFGALKLEPFGSGSVYPHEETFGGPKADRMALMRACKANLSPVFGLVPDEDARLSRALAAVTVGRNADMEVIEPNGVQNRLWVVDDPAQCMELGGLLNGRNVFIADGHHRYETCCTYRNERREQANDPDGKQGGAYESTLMMCVPMSDPGLYILPTHRLIHSSPSASKDSFLREASGLFAIHDADEPELLALAEDTSGAVRVGVIFSDGSQYILAATPASAEAMSAAMPNRSLEWQGLDVAVLQELLLKGVLRLSEEKVLRKEGVSYTPNARQALEKVVAPDGPYSMGFILRPTRIEQVRAVSLAGEKMPQKSTYFYPKLLTGLVLREV